jgi:hypothetical protein
MGRSLSQPQPSNRNAFWNASAVCSPMELGRDIRSTKERTRRKPRAKARRGHTRIVEIEMTFGSPIWDSAYGTIIRVKGFSRLRVVPSAEFRHIELWRQGKKLLGD